jgi:hypothetical protein
MRSLFAGTKINQQENQERDFLHTEKLRRNGDENREMQIKQRRQGVVHAVHGRRSPVDEPEKNRGASAGFDRGAGILIFRTGYLYLRNWLRN